MHSSHESPDTALLHFIERLPTTIREVVLARCCMAFGRLQVIPNQDLFATFRAILKEPESGARAYMCAKMIAVLELALQDDSGRCEAAFDRELREATGVQRFSGIDLRAPLTQRLWQAARGEFLELRDGPLGMSSLHEMLTDAYDRPSQPVGPAPQDIHYGQREPTLGLVR